MAGNPCKGSRVQIPFTASIHGPDIRGVSQNWGYLVVIPIIRSTNTFGSILGSPYLGKMPYPNTQSVNLGKKATSGGSRSRADELSPLYFLGWHITKLCVI